MTVGGEKEMFDKDANQQSNVFLMAQHCPLVGVTGLEL